MDGWMDRRQDKFPAGILFIYGSSVVVLISFPITVNGNTETETDELLFNSGRFLSDWPPPSTRRRNYSPVSSTFLPSPRRCNWESKSQTRWRQSHIKESFPLLRLDILQPLLKLSQLLVLDHRHSRPSSGKHILFLRP